MSESRTYCDTSTTYCVACLRDVLCTSFLQNFSHQVVTPPEEGWSPLFVFGSPPTGGCLPFYFGTIFKTIPRPDVAPAGRETKRGSPQRAPISLSLFLSLRLFIFNRTSTRVTWSRPDPVFQKTNKEQLKIFQMKMDFFFIFFQFDLHTHQTYPGDQGL